MKLKITLTHKGQFYKAWLNDSRITEDELYNLLGGVSIDDAKEIGEFDSVEVNEIDVS
jgi:hypothetical protein